jgi:predicted metal-dependent hydrolase
MGSIALSLKGCPVYISDCLEEIILPVHIDRLVRSRRRTLSLIVERDGSITVRAPLRTPETHIRAFVEGKAGWVRRKQAQLRARAVPAKRYVEGEIFLFLGQAYPLKIVKTQRPALTLNSAFRLSRTALPKAEATFTSWYKAQASQVIGERTAHYVATHGFKVERIRISSARTRWGSCSAKGSLSFTWRLVMAPLEVIDYVVVHELVHLKIKNHSTAFWAGVAGLMPDYKKHVCWLKVNGGTLTLDAR